MLYELDDPDLALLAKARKALAEEKIGALDHDDIADLIRLVNNLAGNDSDDVPRWPYRVMDISPHGYVVWRDVFEGRELSDPQRAALMHQTAVFVCEVEAIDYCRYRNARTVRVGHDGIDYPPQTQKGPAPPGEG